MNTNRKIACLAITAALALTCTLAGGGEVVRFQDGRYLEVEGHQVRGDAVKLILANQSALIMPLERVDSIRSGRVVLYAAATSVARPATDLQAVVRELRPAPTEATNRKRGRS